MNVDQVKKETSDSFPLAAWERRPGRGPWERSVSASLCVACLLGFSLALPAATSRAAEVAATVETALPTEADHIRQFAFDGDNETYFASGHSPSEFDDFTLRFDRNVSVQTINVSTGRPDGTAGLDEGWLEVSADGEAFERVAFFDEGKGHAQLGGRRVLAIRITPQGARQDPLVIREIRVESDPAVATFRYPVEFVLDVSDAPELKAWGDKVIDVCVRAYPMINEELKSDGYTPPHLIHMAIKNDYRGVAAAGGGRIVGSVRYFKAHPDDVGAMVHETTHIVQRYRSRRNPSWLVEGVSDYVRFFKFEPGKIGPIRARTARYNGSYRVTAAFLAYLADRYDKEIVRKLNALMRKGEYKDDIFKDLTGKTLAELDTEWRETLGR